MLGEREETHTQMGASINNITVTDKAYYVPILKIIKTLFCDEKFATQILNETKNNSDLDKNSNISSTRNVYTKDVRDSYILYIPRMYEVIFR